MVMQIRRTRTPDLAPDLAPGQLGVEMGSRPPKLWVGVPPAIDPAARRMLIGGGGGGKGGASTGDVKLTLRATPDPGWIMCNDGSIGNRLSYATTRAEDDTKALFKMLWEAVPSLGIRMRIHTGDIIDWQRGESAEEDFDANRQLVIPRMLGRALALAGQGVGLTNRALGFAGGAEVTALGSTQAANHRHGSTAGWFASFDYYNPYIWASANQPIQFIWSIWYQTHPTGGGGVHSNMQPTSFFHAMMCL